MTALAKRPYDQPATYVGAHPTGYGHILIDHTIRGRTVTSGYAHVYGNGIHVRVGDRVTAGQHIADVGSDGRSTGPTSTSRPDSTAAR